MTRVLGFITLGCWIGPSTWTRTGKAGYSARSICAKSCSPSRRNNANGRSSSWRECSWLPMSYLPEPTLSREQVEDRVFHIVKAFPKVDPDKLTKTSHFYNDLDSSRISICKFPMPTRITSFPSMQRSILSLHIRWQGRPDCCLGHCGFRTHRTMENLADMAQRERRKASTCRRLALLTTKNPITTIHSSWFSQLYHNCSESSGTMMHELW